MNELRLKAKEQTKNSYEVYNNHISLGYVEKTGEEFAAFTEKNFHIGNFDTIEKATDLIFRHYVSPVKK